MKIYLATWLFEPAQGTALTNAGASERLLSYFHCRGRKSEEFDHYWRTGCNENLAGNDGSRNGRRR